ncbi:PREDICTED: venom carboxylesterase-6-like [Eufriesea mexicana]|uniref:venom carboxylesterase-6-like n=1 Tax=Eufriesea mexicana TaxID=516756 RepID=UPI00083BC4A9|nr:PREDICTED: venom carboxylesterase-6-like [Eufriesea mexicana]
MFAVKVSVTLFLLGFLDSSLQNDRIPWVSTSLGTIQGYYKISRQGREYEAFEGIPYGQPPVGELRFQPPHPAEEWSGVLSATKKGSICTQYLMRSLAIDGQIITGDEDCLYVNIYAPIRNGKNTLLPVIFWIHGGAYLFGSGNDMNETLIMDRYWLFNPFSVFGPVVEKHGPDAFITRSPIDVINSGEAYDVPWISGVVSEEGLYTSAEFVANNTLLKHLNDNWDDIAPYLLDFNDTIPLNEKKQVAEKIRKHYLGSEPIDSNSMMPVIHMMGDRLFAHNFERAARLQARKNKSPVWTYLYSYRSMYSLSDTLSGTTRNFGVSHSDDTFLVIDTRTSSVTRPSDVQMQQILLDFYTSYAIDGKPRVGNAVWPSLNPNDKDFHYLHITNPRTIKMESNSDFAQRSFWTSINFDENK